MSRVRKPCLDMLCWKTKPEMYHTLQFQKSTGVKEWVHSCWTTYWTSPLHQTSSSLTLRQVAWLLRNSCEVATYNQDMVSLKCWEKFDKHHQWMTKNPNWVSETNSAPSMWTRGYGNYPGNGRTQPFRCNFLGAKIDIMIGLVLLFIVAATAESCLVPDAHYPFPNTKITADYFQWLRQLSDQRTWVCLSQYWA